MITRSSSTLKQTTLAIALMTLLGSLSPLASANPILIANAGYDIGAGPESDSDGPSATSVDILDGAFSSTGDIFYHTYGNASGVFGSRVSGFGEFEITSSFSFEKNYTNLTGISQDYFFDFSIIPGGINTSILDSLVSVGTLFSSFEIEVILTTANDSVSIFNSAASITTDFTGSVFTETGTSLGGSLFDNSYVWNEYTASISLGSFSANEEFAINYILTTQSSSDIALSSEVCGSNGGGEQEFEEEEPGEVGCMAAARSGDPFGLNGGNTFTTSMQPTSLVPEPNVLLLMGVGLLGAMAGRRKIKSDS